MTNYLISVTGAQVEIVEREGILTEGMVGAYVNLMFDGVWDGLTKIVVFKAGKIARDQVYNGGPVEIPPEVLARPIVGLTIGVYGYDGENHLVIPTEPIVLDNVREGTEPSGSGSVKPTPSATQQMMAMTQSSKEAAEAALRAAEEAELAAKAAEPAAQRAEDATQQIQQNADSVELARQEVAQNRQVIEELAGPVRAAAEAAVAAQQATQQAKQDAETAAQRSENAAAQVKENATQAQQAADTAAKAAEQASKEAQTVAANAEALITAKVEEAVSQRTPVAILDITIPAEGWVAAEGEDPYTLYIDVPCETARAVHFPDIALDRAALSSAREAGLCPSASALNGSIRFWAEIQPAADMTATVALLTASTGTPGTGGAINGDIASDEEVEEVLGEVFDQGNVASDTEVQEAVQDIFGEEAVNE